MRALLSFILVGILGIICILLAADNTTVKKRTKHTKEVNLNEIKWEVPKVNYNDKSLALDMLLNKKFNFESCSDEKEIKQCSK